MKTPGILPTPATRPDAAARPVDRSWHWMVLVGALAVVIAGGAADVASDGSLFMCGNTSLKVPVICPVRRFLGTPCLACGMTRSVTHLLHGRVADSLTMHRLGWLVLLGVAFQFPYRAWRLTGRSSWFDSPGVQDLLLAGFFLLLCLNWLMP